MSSLARNVTLEQKPEMHRDVNNPWKYIQYQVMRSEKENAVAYSASLGPFFPYASVQTNGQYGYYGNIVSVPSRLLRNEGAINNSRAVLPSSSQPQDALFQQSFMGQCSRTSSEIGTHQPMPGRFQTDFRLNSLAAIPSYLALPPCLSRPVLKFGDISESEQDSDEDDKLEEEKQEGGPPMECAQVAQEEDEDENKRCPELSEIHLKTSEKSDVKVASGNFQENWRAENVRVSDDGNEPCKPGEKTKRKAFKPQRSASKVDPCFQGVTFQVKTETKKGGVHLTITSYFSYPRKILRARLRKYSPCKSPSAPLDSSSDTDEIKSPKHEYFFTSVSGKQCASCGTRKTPLWRDAEDGTPLCNACGIRYKKYRLRCGNCWHIPKKESKSYPRCPRCGELLRFTITKKYW